MEQNICYCGQKAVRGEGLLRNTMACPSCGTEWEITHCWNCGEKIDGRFSSFCRECDWFICPNCGAHEPDCTNTIKALNKTFVNFNNHKLI